MLNLKTLSRICSFLMLMGPVLIIGAGTGLLPPFTWAIISITGFAAVVKVFLPLPHLQSSNSIGAAIVGALIIIMSFAYMIKLT